MIFFISEHNSSTMKINDFNIILRLNELVLIAFIVYNYGMFMEKLKKIFKVKSTYQLVIVFIVFGITGSLSLFVSDYILDFLNLDSFILSLLLLLMIYQILLIIIGTLFGEFTYFWAMEKKIISRFNFSRSKTKSS